MATRKRKRCASTNTCTTTASASTAVMKKEDEDDGGGDDNEDNGGMYVRTCAKCGMPHVYVRACARKYVRRTNVVKLQESSTSGKNMHADYVRTYVRRICQVRQVCELRPVA